MSQPVTVKYAARIEGDIDITKLAPAQAPEQLGERQQLADTAMRELLATDFTDYYLMENNVPDPPSLTRTKRMAFGSTGVWLPNYAGETNSHLQVWIGDGPQPALMTSKTPPGAPVSTVYTGVVPALLFRKLWGSGPRTFNLGNTWGFFTFTPRRIKVPWLAGDPGMPTGMFHDFAYDAPTLSNYVRTPQSGAEREVWLWFTDPTTGEAGEEWWKVSHLVRRATDPVSTRLDDPLQTPAEEPVPLQPTDGGW